ncbi:MAG: type II secretion system F family protein [Candidatus Eisenbacteria bacterium]
MAVFSYQAKRTPSETTAGQIEAENQEAALSKLAQMGYFPISITERTAQGRPIRIGFPGFRRRVSSRALAAFTRQLADLLEGGLPVLGALTVLRGQTDSPELKETVEGLRLKLEQGERLSQGLASYPHVFSDLYVNMVRSGEVSGALEEILTRLADFIETQDEVRAKVRSAMAYPILVVSMSIVTVLVLMIVVIPKLTSMFQELGQELPLPTRVLMGVTRVGSHYGIIILVAIVGAYLLLRHQSRKGKGRLMLDGMKLGLPALGKLYQRIEIARFARTLGILLRNGVPMVEALDVVNRTIQNMVMRAELERTRTEVTEGERLGRSLARVKHFPAFVTSVISVGEESNFLEKSLARIADSYDREIDRSIKVLISLLEPGITVLMGGIVGLIVMSILLAIFRIDFLAK